MIKLNRKQKMKNQKGVSSFLIILIVVGVLVTAGGIYFFVIQKPAQYKDSDTAIAFKYPSNLFLLDRDEDGSKMLPNIFFQSYQYPKGYSRNACPVDCINFSAFLRRENGLPYYDIPLQVEKNNPKFPIYDYPQYIYQDETGSKPLRINGMEAVRYYAAGLTDYYVNERTRNPATPIEYVIEDRVFIKDPNLKERIIYVVYQEKTNKLPSSAESLSATIIKGLFNREKYRTFQSILSTLEALPVDTNEFATYASQEIGVSFQYPKYWGNVVEAKGIAFGSEPPIETFNISFMSPLFSWDDPAEIDFEVDNSKTAKYAYEGAPPLFQYAGQLLYDACQKNAYLDSSGWWYDVKITECNLRTLPNSIKVVVFKGNFAYKYDYGEGEISPEKRQFIPFKGAILQTKSSKGPGMSIHFKSITGFTELEKIFDRIVDSLSYENKCIGGFTSPTGGERLTIGQKIRISWIMPLGIDIYYNLDIDLLNEQGQKLGSVISGNWVKYEPYISADWDVKTVYNPVSLEPDLNIQLQPGKYKLKFSYKISDSHTEDELGNCDRQGIFESNYFEIAR